MKVTIEKGLGNPFLNAVRAAAYIAVPCIRPIAFQVGGESNVISISDSVIEDMTTFISSVSCRTYSYTGNTRLVKAVAECNGCLKLSDLLQGTGIRFDRDVEVLHSRAPVTVTVYFAVQAGMRLDRENRELLGEQCGDFVVTNSRHCVVEKFTYHRVDDSDDREVYEIELETLPGSTPEEVLRLAINRVKMLSAEVFNSMS